MPLLENRENQFLDKTKSSTNNYINNIMVSDLLIRCTNNRINANNFIIQFETFLPCIENKMLKISTSSISNFSIDKKIKKPKEPFELPPLIDPKDIANAIREGYDELKPIIEELAESSGIDINDFDNFQALATTTVLVIIARASLERQFN